MNNRRKTSLVELAKETGVPSSGTKADIIGRLNTAAGVGGDVSPLISPRRGGRALYGVAAESTVRQRGAKGKGKPPAAPEGKAKKGAATRACVERTAPTRRRG